MSERTVKAFTTIQLPVLALHPLPRNIRLLAAYKPLVIQPMISNSINHACCLAIQPRPSVAVTLSTPYTRSWQYSATPHPNPT